VSAVRAGQVEDLPGVVRRHAQADPGRTAMTFVDFSTAPEGEARHLTYGELDLRIRAVGAHLRRTVRPGARAAILCPTGVEYVVGFLACLYAGVVAVPLFALEPYRRNDRVARVMDDCGCEVAITPQSARAAVAGIPLTAPVRIICPDEVDPDPSIPWDPVPVDPAATAYLQYTSGSTRQPAGVRVTHRNVATAAEQLAGHLSCDENSSMVSWIPLFHDMGLVFAVVLPLTSRFPAVHLTSFAFVRDPRRWLRLLGEHRGTHVLVPNFGLDVCVDRVSGPERAGLDLSRLVYLGSGAEPVRPRTLARFTEAFAPYGFSPLSHSPAYGLAEATLMVTGVRPGERAPVRSFDRAALNAGRVRPASAGHPGALAMVGCGAPLDQEVRIVDPETARASAPDEVGEIWVRGENVCAGYWNREARADEVFGAVLEGEGGWLRTGDLGFFAAGSLFVAGRRKDLIIIDGRNHHPSDIEATVEQEVTAVRPGHCITFAIDTGDREEIAVVAETMPGTTTSLATLRTMVRRAVAANHDLSVSDVVFVRRGTLPKTSSGKLQRRACRDQYERGAMTAVPEQVVRG
jgi:acyl-CoA synthetase (AMP-forming)/AMP-acid ligase II